MSFVQEIRDDDVLRWVINRPERGNAIGSTVTSVLVDLLKKLEKSVSYDKSAPIALILTAATAGKPDLPIWIAGGDLEELSNFPDQATAAKYASEMSNFCAGLAQLPIPVVALIDGRAIGGGAELALATDIRIATSRSTLEFAQLGMGLATGYGSARRIIDLVGLAKATELLFLQRVVSAAEARQSSLFQHVASQRSSAEEFLGELIQAWRRSGRASLQCQKRMFSDTTLASDPNSRSRELQQFAQIWRNPAHEQRLRQWQSRKK